jgi:hypothetical protein
MTGVVKLSFLLDDTILVTTVSSIGTGFEDCYSYGTIPIHHWTGK